MIRVQVSDITALDVEAIVNAANSTLLGGGGVDGAIHRAAGPELLEACRRLGGCATGEARITPGFRLPARWVIHAVGPVWRGGSRGEADLLASAYRASFELALRAGARTIAFPSISTGAYGFPRTDAARIALGLMREYEDRFQQVIACCFSEADAAVYRTLLAATPSRDSGPRSGPAPA